jgi:hypothetical protein
MERGCPLEMGYNMDWNYQGLDYLGNQNGSFLAPGCSVACEAACMEEWDHAQGS